jgi:hypothetical protein
MADSPSKTRIDRLVLDLPGGSTEYGRQVAMLVAAGLAAANALPASGDLPALRVTVAQGSQGSPQAEPAALARRIVAATLRDLARTP